MISELVFEQIDGNFWYAAYGPFRVVMMKDTGYINATKMCSSGDKEYRDWAKNKSSRELIQALENQLALENAQDSVQISNCRIPRLQNLACKHVQTRNRSDEDQLISGTYCHPLLIPHIACWVSPDFALMVSKVVNGYITQEYKSKLSAMQLQLEQATELREAATQDAHHAHLLRDDAILVAHQANQQIQQKEHRHQVWSSTHAFTMLRLNNPEAKLPYYGVRCKRDSMSGCIKKLRAKHPYSIMVYQNSCVPNPINLYRRLKESGVVLSKLNYCNPLVGEAELIVKLGELCTIVK